MLVASLPRSGSSWVGDMLGSAPDALYLREPISQGDPEFYYKGTVIPPDEPDVRVKFRRLARKAFLGWPDFEEKIVRSPGQWALGERRRRRLVIKEVNPLAVGYFLRHYRPRLVFLVRHPAAVALSHVKQGWMARDTAAWADNGVFQGKHLSEAWAMFKDYPAREVVSYEGLCADPLGQFRRLFDFAGLTWDDAVRDRIAYYSRDNERRIRAWRDEAPADAVKAQRETYRAFDLPWYQADEDW